MNDPYKTPEFDSKLVIEEEPAKRPKLTSIRFWAISIGSILAAVALIYIWAVIFRSASLQLRSYLAIAGKLVSYAGLLAFVILVPVIIWRGASQVRRSSRKPESQN